VQANLWKPTGSIIEVGLSVTDVRTPAFLVDKIIVQKNCEKMLATCKELCVTLRAQT